MTREKSDRLVHKIGRQVVASFECSRRINARIVEHEVWSVLVGFRIHEPIEPIEAAPQRPPVERPGRAGFSKWGDVPFAYHVAAISMQLQYLGQSSCFLSNLPAIAGKAAVEIRKA